eukprot:1130698-Rhodomonas_salina.1
MTTTTTRMMTRRRMAKIRAVRWFGRVVRNEARDTLSLLVARPLRCPRLSGFLVQLCWTRARWTGSIAENRDYAKCEPECC